MKLDPFGDIPVLLEGWSNSAAEIAVGSRWEMRGVDRGPENDFTVTSVAGPLRAGEFAVTTYRPSVSYRLTGSDDEPTRRDYGDFKAEFIPYGTVVTYHDAITVTGKRIPGGFPWWLLAAGAVLLMS